MDIVSVSRDGRGDGPGAECWRRKRGEGSAGDEWVTAERD